MKKFYTVFLMALVALLTAPAMSATITITLQAERAGEAEWSQSSYSGYTPLEAGDNVIELQDDWGYYYVYIKPADGFRLDEIQTITGNSNLEYGSPYDYNSTYLNDSDDGNVYKVITSNPDDSRTSSVTLKIEGDASKVRFRRKDIPTDLYPEAGDNIVKFNPATELPLRFFFSDNPFPSFTLDGEKVAPTSGSYYDVRPTDGQTIAISTEWPDEDVAVRINVPEGCEDMIKKVSVFENYTLTKVDYLLNQDFTIKCGKELRIEADDNNFVINTVKANGEKLYRGGDSWSGYYYSVFVGADPVTIDFDATVKQVLKFYLNVEADGLALYDTNYGYNYQPLMAGNNEVVPKENSWGYQQVYVKSATSDYKLVRIYSESVKEDGSPKYLYEIGKSSDYINFSPEAGMLNEVLKVELMNLEEARTAVAHITVTDDPSKVYTHTRGGKEFDMSGCVAGEVFDVKFIPEDEAKFVFGGDEIPLASVKLNGEVVAGQGASSITRELTLKDGDEVTITANFADVDVPVTITIPEKAAGAVKSVMTGMVNYDCTEAVDFKLNEPFTIKAGRFVKIDLDEDNFKVKGKTLDGEYWGSSTFFLGEVEAVNVDIDASPIEPIHFTVNVTDPSHITILQGEYSGPQLKLTGTTNALEVPEKEPAIRIEATQGNAIKSITDANGNEPERYNSWGGDAYRVNEGDVFNIETVVIEYDGKWGFWIDDMSTVQTGMHEYGYPLDPWWAPNGGDHDFNTEAGYKFVPCASALNEKYVMQIYPKTTDAHFYFGDREYQIYYGYFYVDEVYPHNGDIFRLYAKEPGRFDITFALEGDEAEELGKEIKVATDIINDRPDWQAGFTKVFEGAQVDITAPADRMVSVTVDGTSLQPNEEGKYSFVTTANHEVKISSSSAIEGLEADAAVEDGAVYNLLGVKVLDKASASDLKALPAGVYLMNGKKIVVK